MFRQLSLGTEDSHEGPGHNSTLAKDKNTSGYSFQAVETHKSSWQIFKSLLWLRTLIRFREPGMFFVQIVMPIAFICLGVFLSDMSNPQADKDSQAILTPQMYSDFDPHIYGFQNVKSDPQFVSSFEKFNGKPLDIIEDDVEFPNLLGRDLMTVLKAEEGNNHYVGYFNDTAQHSIPILVNAMSNTYALLYELGKNIIDNQ